MAHRKTEASTFTPLMLRLPQHVLEECRQQATRHRRSMNSQIIIFLEERLAQEKHQDPLPLRPTGTSVG